MKGDYASYEIDAPAGVFLTSGENIVGQHLTGFFTWTVADVFDNIVEVDASLTLGDLIKTIRFQIREENLLFIDGSYVCKNLFWMSDLENGAVIPLYQDENRVENGTVKGPYTTETIQGYQESWIVETISPWKGEGILTAYWYDKDNGFLLKVFIPAGPLFNLFGIDCIFGNIVLKSTNLNLGPESIPGWVVTILEILPVIVFIVVIVILLIFVRKRISAYKR
jgi:hypothetical protein